MMELPKGTAPKSVRIPRVSSKEESGIQTRLTPQRVVRYALRWEAVEFSFPSCTCDLSARSTTTNLIRTIHFVALTSGRQTDFSVLEWPSTLYAVELLARDIFLGLSLLCAAFVFVGSGIRAFARWSLAIAGRLSLLGAIGTIVGDMVLQRIGILGYGVGLPVAALALSRFFHRNDNSLTWGKGQD